MPSRPCTPAKTPEAIVRKLDTLRSVGLKVLAQSDRIRPQYWDVRDPESLGAITTVGARGALCVLDTRPRHLSATQRECLLLLARQLAIPLVIGTKEWWRVRESARWIVTNEWLRGRYVKKPFQTVLQTWHGSMYKRIGMDRGGAGLLRGGHSDRARAERANWDMFISQNGDTTGSYWNPSGDQNRPAMGGFDALGPALDAITQRFGRNAVPSQGTCSEVPSGCTTSPNCPWSESGSSG